VETPTSAQSYLGFIAGLDCPEADPGGWSATHVKGWYCPAKFAEEKPVMYKHQRNGVIVAANEKIRDRVFLTCTECKEKFKTNSYVKRMQTKCGFMTAYYELSEKGLKDIFSDEGQLSPCGQPCSPLVTPLLLSRVSQARR